MSISVDKSGVVYLDEQPLGTRELAALLTTWQKTNAALRVFIRGDQDARHGDVVRVLDAVRSSGIEKVSFEIQPAGRASSP